VRQRGWMEIEDANAGVRMVRERYGERRPQSLVEPRVDRPRKPCKRPRDRLVAHQGAAVRARRQ
jgi:hypothetical protein